MQSLEEGKLSEGKKNENLNLWKLEKHQLHLLFSALQSGHLYHVLVVPGKWHIAILELTNGNIRRTVCFQKTVEMMPCLRNPIYNFD